MRAEHDVEMYAECGAPVLLALIRGAKQVSREQVEIFFVRTGGILKLPLILSLFSVFCMTSIALSPFCHISWANPGTEHGFHLRSGLYTSSAEDGCYLASCHA